MLQATRPKPESGAAGLVTGSKISDGSADSEAVDVTIAVGGDLTPRTNQDRLGSSSLVRRNSTSEPFSKGWQLSGVDALDTNETGGILWVRDDGTAGLYSPLAERRGASLDPRVSATAILATPLGAGRITRMTGEDGTVDYGYDPTSQLTSADYSDPSLTDESYSFDLVGNRTMTGYQTGTGNRLLSDGTYSYEYDDEGNRTKRTKTSTGEVTEYEWDFRNRLTKVTEKDASGSVTKVVEYTYDVFNRRIAKEVDTTSSFDMQDAASERYVYDDIHNGMASLDGGNVVLHCVDSDGPGGSGAMTLSKRYLWGERVDELLAQEDVTKSMSATDRVLWPIVDHLGTVRDLAKQDGAVATHFVYTAFGGIVSGDTSLTRYLFTSREFDAETGLQYNRARWYDTATGRWISEDPLGFAVGDVNTARYVGNGVVGWSDPNGLWPPSSSFADLQAENPPTEGRYGQLVWIDAPEDDGIPEDPAWSADSDVELPKPREEEISDEDLTDGHPKNVVREHEETEFVGKVIKKMHAVEWFVLIGPIVEFGAMAGTTMAEGSELIFHDLWLGDRPNDRNEWVEAQKKLNETWREEWNNLLR